MATELPSFAIMGSGGVGGYFGARLTQAGLPVTFIARGAHLAAMRNNGLIVDDRGETSRIEARATDTPAEVGRVDFVLFCVKLWDTETAGRMCSPLLGQDSAVVSLQNGIDSEGILQSLLGENAVMGGVAEISSTVAAPGHIAVSTPHRMRFGELDRRASERGLRLEQALNAAGISFDHSQDIETEIWRKFVFLVGLSAATAVTRRPIGDVRSDPDTRNLLIEVMAEALEVALRKGIRLAPSLIDDRLAVVDQDRKSVV